MWWWIPGSPKAFRIEAARLNRSTYFLFNKIFSNHRYRSFILLCYNNIKFQLTGFFLELYVNGIKVSSPVIPFAINRTQVRILVKS